MIAVILAGAALALPSAACRRAHTAAPAAVPSHTAVTALTPAELAAKTGSGRWLIVEFGGRHCIPCMRMRMQPVLQDIQKVLGKRAEIHNFWVRDHLAVARRLRIMVIPTQIIFNPDGKEAFRHQGFFPEKDFLAHLRKEGVL